MSEHFLFTQGVQEVVPFSAKYGMPTQSVRSSKTIVQIQPKGSQSYANDTIMRLEFPASGYLDGVHSTLNFTICPLTNAAIQGTDVLWSAQNIHSCITRLRVLYGSLVIEDIIDYNKIVTAITNHNVPVAGNFRTGTRTLQKAAVVGNVPNGAASTVATPYLDFGPAYQGWEEGLGSEDERNGWFTATGGNDTLAGGGQTKGVAFSINLMSGLLKNKKLIPLKWMSSQLAIEITFAPKDDVFKLCKNDATAGSTFLTGYVVHDINYQAELVEFDTKYDAVFYQGLQESGVPIKIQTWNTYKFTPNAASYHNMQIQERSRSVQLALWSWYLPTPTALSAAAAAAADGINNTFKNNVTTYQWRIGGKYYPAQPVKCDSIASQAHVELRKAFKTLGDYDTLSLFNSQCYTSEGTAAAADCLLPARWLGGTDLTTMRSSGSDIAGLNAEEQSDMNLQLYCSTNSQAIYILHVFVLIDKLLIIRANNTVDLYV